MDEILFGKGNFFPEVHKYLDQMQPYLQTRHREFYHDMETVSYIYQSTCNELMALSAYFHILLDLTSDEVGQEHAIAELIDKIRKGEVRI